MMGGSNGGWGGALGGLGLAGLLYMLATRTEAGKKVWNDIQSNMTGQPTQQQTPDAPTAKQQLPSLPGMTQDMPKPIHGPQLPTSTPQPQPQLPAASPALSSWDPYSGNPEQRTQEAQERYEQHINSPLRQWQLN